MADGVTTDFSDVMKLAADLGNAAGEVEKPLKSALAFAAQNVKEDVRSQLAGDAFFKGAAGSVNYDVTVKSGRVDAEVGYDKDRRGGALGNLREFGAPNAQPYGNPFAPTTPLAPHNDLQNALERERPDFEKGVDVAVNDALKAARL